MSASAFLTCAETGLTKVGGGTNGNKLSGVIVSLVTFPLAVIIGHRRRAAVLAQNVEVPGVFRRRVSPGQQAEIGINGNACALRLLQSLSQDVRAFIGEMRFALRKHIQPQLAQPNLLHGGNERVHGGGRRGVSEDGAAGAGAQQGQKRRGGRQFLRRVHSRIGFRLTGFDSGNTVPKQENEPGMNVGFDRGHPRWEPEIERYIPV